MDQTERDKFYGRSWDDDDDDVEYEVEPPDAEVLALNKSRAEELIKDSEMSVDVDEFYREIDRPSDSDLPFKWPADFRFQFTVKHLLLATAVLAVMLTMWRMQMANVGGVFMLILMGVALAYVEIKEQRRHIEAERRWQEKNERRRRYMERRSLAYRPKNNSPSTIYDDVPFHGDAPAAESPLADTRFRFQFSLRSLMAGMTGAALVLGFVYIVGTPAIAAMFLGIVAVGGLVLYTFGVRPPQFVIWGWWLVLVLYIVMGLVTELQKAFS